MVEFRDGELFSSDGVPIRELAENFGTPLFVYSADEFVGRLRAVSESAKYPHIICFSVKSNNVLFLLREVANWGWGADVVSAGELFIARKAGIPPEKIVFSGIGKTNEEISYANKVGILLLNIESEGEYKFVKELSRSQELKFGISFRVKFEVELSKLHPYLGVGKKESKFGLTEDEAFSLYQDAVRAGLPVMGIHFHLGSQILDMSIFKSAVDIALPFLDRLRSSGIDIKYVDVGGGLGINYESGEHPDPSEYTEIFKPIASQGYTIIFELGRYISAPSGILITCVIRRKKSGEHEFLIVDAGMTELLRIPLYSAYHRVVPVKLRNTGRKKFRVVGPICENSDYISQSAELPDDIDEGDILCVLDSGAYTSTMRMNYNGRPFPSEVVLKNGRVYIARKRQSFEDLVWNDTESHEREKEKEKEKHREEEKRKIK